MASEKHVSQFAEMVLSGRADKFLEWQSSYVESEIVVYGICGHVSGCWRCIPRRGVGR